MTVSSSQPDPTSPVDRASFWSAALTAALSTISLGVAVTTPPRSGPFAAPGTAIAYPYDSAAEFVPRDFLWMYPALLMMVAYLALAACIRDRAAGPRRTLGTIGLSLAVASFSTIAIDYFIQLRTVQPSLLRGETEGLAILSQYNPHGVFIALEELGFLLMGLSFALLGLALGESRLERVARWTLVTSALLIAASFVGLSYAFGFELEYRYEVAAISLAWLTLIGCGSLLAVAFRRSRAAR